jgi:4-hydroxyphenylpyruvate dioxygenase
MRRSIATVCLSGDLKGKLEAIAATGFEGFELFENDLLSFEGTAREVRQMAQDLGLCIVTLQPFRDFEGLPEPQRSRALLRAERKMDVMEQLGTDLFFVCSSTSPHSSGSLERIAEDLYELGQRAQQRGFRVGYEALAWSKHIHDYRDAWEVVRRANHPAVGIILDTFHILARNLDLSAIAKIPKEKIFLVQVADAPLLEMGVLPWSRHFRSFPGQGQLPLARFMQVLGETRYDGWLSLEVFNDQFRTTPPKETALDGYRSLVYLQENPLNKLPIQTGGVAFVEFAVSEEMAPTLGRFFQALGFQQTGQHRSKEVGLWQQGQINLILNAEPGSFAQAYNQVHGTSVCAVAVLVDEVDQVLQRAQTYKAPIFYGPTGPGEHQIPALRGLDGSLLYLVEAHQNLRDFWAVDFELAEKAPLAACGLQRIDHLAQVMPAAQVHSWVLFYRTILGLQTSNLLEIPDPGGLIQSQVAESSDKSLRLVLNASQAGGTLASRFLNEYYGGGVQHIAFSTSDIFATLEQLQQNGLRLLPIPQNYYDDLEARYGLEPALLKRLQALNILYDQSPEGEFFHAYTQTFDDLFFIEIVERRGYDGYGAVNAPIRIAAQTRLIKTSLKSLLNEA